MALEKASKIDLIRSFGKLSLDKIVEEKYPTIGMLEREHSQERVEKVVKMLVHDLSSSFNDDLDQDDVEEIAVEINSSMLRNMSLEDVYYTCRQIKAGDVYGKLNVNKVLKAFDKHLDAKIDATYKKNINKHLSNKHVDNEPVDVAKEMEKNMKAATYYEMNKEQEQEASKKWNNNLKTQTKNAKKTNN